MPTGYTAGIEDGTITNFKQYAFQCMRAFGACLEFRDDPLSTEIPKLSVTTYHKDKLQIAIDELEEFEQLNQSDLADKFQIYKEKEIDRIQKNIIKEEEIANRYNTILAEVIRFTPPTPQHKDYKVFMKNQIELCLNNDTIEYYHNELTKISKITKKKWIKDQRAALEWDIEYHTKEIEKEEYRVKTSNDWIDAVKDYFNNKEQTNAI